MSSKTSLKKDFSQLRDEWMELDPTLRLMDLTSIALILLFGIGYILVNVLDITMTVSNAAMLIFPLILSGYIYVLRTKLRDENKDNSEAKREFLLLVGITVGLILFTFIYSLLLNQVLL